MNNDAFLRHHGLTANPFRGEEARQDVIFDRIEHECRHPDFDKIVGDLDRPSSSVVFGERGSGKTAIRLQIERLIRERETSTDDGRAKLWMVAYDDFNDLIARFMRTVGEDDPAKALEKYKLPDHMDGLLLRTVPSVVDALLRDRSDVPALGKPSEVKKAVRALPEETRQRLLRMQICYDRPEGVSGRTKRLKRLLKAPGGAGVIWSKRLASLFGILGAAWFVIAAFFREMVIPDLNVSYEVAQIPTIVLLIGAAWMTFRWLTSAWRVRRTGKGIQRGIRVDDRAAESFQLCLLRSSKEYMTERELPLTDFDSPRYAYFDALLDLLRQVGYSSMIVLVDRLDEPTAINGNAARMKSFIWPMFNNKFLQMNGVGFKMLLPLELRSEIMKEREEFFREARLDKQHMIERLAWSGSMLYDLCNARFRACLGREARQNADATIKDLFDESVTRQELIDALDQLQQPRDAFKFLYAVIQEHCSNNSTEDESFTIPRVTLDLVRKREVMRKDGMLRGTMPA